MKKLISTLNLSHEEWLRSGRKGIGGSDAGAVCGLNPYRTAMQVYHDKTSDEIETVDNEAVRQGRAFEDYVAKRFMEASGKKVRRSNTMYYDEKNSFMLADVDRMVVSENAGLECKTASPYMADKWRDGRIPLSYQIQCYHYMSVCNAEAWYIAVLIYGREFKYYRLERDDEIIRDLVQIEKVFWEENVCKKVMPDPDGSRLADQMIAEYYKDAKTYQIPLTGFNEKLERRQELISVMERMDQEKKQIEQELKVYLGEAEAAENEHYRVSWKLVRSSRLDEKRLKEEEPGIYEKYKKEVSSRRLLVKPA